MRILHVTSLFLPDRVGGAELFVDELSRSLHGMGHDVAVAALSREEHRRVTPDGIPVFGLGHATSFFVLDWERQPAWKRMAYKAAVQLDRQTARRMKRVLDVFRPDIVNTHSLSELSPRLWRAAAQCGVPVVHTLHDFASMCTNASLFHASHVCDGRNPKCHLFAALHRRCHRHVGAVAAVGSDILERHLRAGFFGHVPEDGRRVVWNPVAPPRGVRSRMPSKPGAPVVFGYLGRLEPAKGADLLLQAARLLPAQGWELLLAGRAPGGDARYRAAAEGLPVRFPGYMDADDFFGRIDCLVVPPLWPEAFGRTVAEALLRRVPVIGADIGGVSEQLGVVGGDRLFPPGNAAALAALMEKAIRQPDLLTQELPNLDRIAERIRPQAVAEAHAALYRTLLER